jgi:hypothetical protein
MWPMWAMCMRISPHYFSIPLPLPLSVPPHCGCLWVCLTHSHPPTCTHPHTTRMFTGDFRELNTGCFWQCAWQLLVNIIDPHSAAIQVYLPSSLSSHYIHSLSPAPFFHRRSRINPPTGAHLGLSSSSSKAHPTLYSVSPAPSPSFSLCVPLPLCLSLSSPCRGLFHRRSPNGPSKGHPASTCRYAGFVCHSSPFFLVLPSSPGPSLRLFHRRSPNGPPTGPIRPLLVHLKRVQLAAR